MAKEKNDNWMQQLWRPAMGWLYMLVCFCDMIVFPVLWALWQGINHVPITQWSPLSLQGAGLFHIAMGAVLGIAAFGRTQEKLAGTAANPTATEQISINQTSMSGVPAGGMNNGMGGGFGGSSGGFGGSSGGFGGSSGGFGSASSFGGASSGGFGSPASGGFGSTPLGGNSASTVGFGSPAPATSAAPAPTFSTPGTTSSTGKPLGPAQSFPAL